MEILQCFENWTYSNMLVKVRDCARFRDWKRENWFHLARGNLGSEGAEIMHFPLSRIFLHETLPFCFKKLNNFQSERWSEKVTTFWIETSHTSKKTRRFHSWSFHEPLLKQCRDSLKFPSVNSAQGNLGWDEHKKSTFPDENDQNGTFCTKYY